MFTLEMMPAQYGDALWIEYGDPDRPHVVAIDGGPQSDRSPLVSRLRERADGHRKQHLELLIVTHIDADHINGTLAALQTLPAGVTIGDVWFNGFKHLVAPDQLGPETGELLARHLQKSGLPWNETFEGGAVLVPDGGDLPEVELDGGLRLTLLSPNRDKLAKLHKVWKSVVKKAGVAADRLGDIPLPEQETETEVVEDLLGRSDKWPPDVNALSTKNAQVDRAEANGSSIGVLAEYEESEKTRAVLLGADCHSPILEGALDRLLAARGIERLELDAFKLPHHGSHHNLRNQLLEKLRCSRYLISTNGDRFSHPDHEALARVLAKGGAKPKLLFNYRTKLTERWETPSRGMPAYETEYGDEGALLVTLSA